MTIIVLWFIAILYVEAVTEILINGEIFAGFRDFLHNLSDFTSQLITCGYCLSVWVSATIAWALPLPISNYSLINFIVATFALHRLSNVTHEAIVRWLQRFPLLISLNVDHSESPNDQSR